jgi:hypothetical protein
MPAFRIRAADGKSLAVLGIVHEIDSRIAKIVN